MDSALRNRLAGAIFVIGAATSGVWAYLGIRDLAGTYSSGAGAFGSVDSLWLLRYLLPVLITAVLSAFARDRGRSAVVLRRAFLLATLIPIALVVLLVSAAFSGAFVHGVNGIWLSVLIAVLMAGALWLPMQALFAAGFLGLLIKPREG